MNTFLIVILILVILGIVGVVVYIQTKPQTQQPQQKKAVPTKLKDEYSNISYGGSNLCLDSNGKDVYLLPCQEDNPFQRWRINGLNIIQKETQKCLDGNEGAVYGSPCPDNEDYKQWKFLDTGHILHLRDGDQCIAVKDSKVVLQPCDYTGKSQTWKIKN